MKPHRSWQNMYIRLISLGHAHIQTSRRIVLAFHISHYYLRSFFPLLFALQEDMPAVCFHVRVDDVGKHMIRM